MGVLRSECNLCTQTLAHMYTRCQIVHGLYICSTGFVKLHQFEGGLAHHFVLDTSNPVSTKLQDY